MRCLILYISLLIFGVGCNFDYKVGDSAGAIGGGSSTAPNVLGLVISGNPTSVNVNEGSSVVIIPALTMPTNQDVQIDIDVTSPRNDVAGFFTQVFPLSATIPEGQTSTPITIYTSADPTFTGNLSFQLTVSSPQLSSSVTLNINLIDGQTLILGSFSIDGVVDAAEVMDTTIDARLHNALTPKLSWQASSNATSYNVSILEDDGVTVKCPVVNTTQTSLALPVTCQLTEGSFYRAKVVARASVVSENAPLFRFEVTSNITLSSDVAVMMYNGGAITFDPRANDMNPTAIITGVEVPSSGSTSFTASSVTYTPNGSTTGLISFLYTVNDNGMTSMGRIRLKLMSAHTWTGAVDTNFATTGNWCGSVTTPGLAGVCSGGAAPNNTQKAIIDNTCESNCNVVIADSSTVNVGGIELSANSLTMGQGSNLNTGSFGYKQTAGSFDGANAVINFTSTYSGGVYSGIFELLGGSFKSSSSSLKIQNIHPKFESAASFDHNSGKVTFGSNWNFQQEIKSSNHIFHDVEFKSNGLDDIRVLLLDTMNVDGDMSVGVSGVRTTIYGHSIKLKGNLDLSTKGFTEGNTVVELIGNPAGQTVSGYTPTGAATSGVTGLKINSGTHNVTITGGVLIRDAGYEVATVGTLDVHDTIFKVEADCNGDVKFIPGNAIYKDFIIGDFCHDLDFSGGVLKLAGNLILENDGYPAVGFDNGTIEVGGNIDMTIGELVEGDGIVRMVGNPAGQTVTGGPKAFIPNLYINAGTNPVTMTGRVGVFGHYELQSAGTFTAPQEIAFENGCVGYDGAVEAKIKFGGRQYNDVTIGGGCPVVDLDGETTDVLGHLKFGVEFKDGQHGEIRNGTLNVYGDVIVDQWDGFAGDAKVVLKGNALGQTVYANVDDSYISGIEINSAHPVTFSGAGKLIVDSDFNFVAASSFTQNNTIRLGTGECPASYERHYSFGNVTYGNLEIQTYCRDVYFLSNLSVGGNLTYDSNGTIHLQGHSVTVVGTLTLGSATVNP